MVIHTQLPSPLQDPMESWASNDRAFLAVQSELLAPPEWPGAFPDLCKALQSFAVTDGMAGVLLRQWMATLHLRRGEAHQREIILLPVNA
jgi:hypothetical protein